MIGWLVSKSVRAEREALRIVTEVARQPPQGRLEVLKREIADLPEDLRRVVEPLVLASSDAARPPPVATAGERLAAVACVFAGVALFVTMLVLGVFSAETGEIPRSWERGLAGAGLTGLLVLWLVSIVNPYESAHGRRLGWTIAALASAGVAASLPGFLEIEFSGTGRALRGGGAIAVFLLVYLEAGRTKIEGGGEEEGALAQ